MSLTVWVGNKRYHPDWVAFGLTKAKMVWTERKREMEISIECIDEISTNESSIKG
jgi:hypothetical protein